MFKPNPLFYTDGYKPSHNAMLAPGTTKLYGTWIPRSLKYAPKGVTKILSFGQQYVWRWIHDQFEENFFKSELRLRESTNAEKLHNQRLKERALNFTQKMNDYLGLPYDGKHFEELWDLGYLPVKVKALPEGVETGPNIPHMTFVNTVDGFAWLTLYLETIVSSLAWKPSTSATIALQYRRNVEEWVNKTDPQNAWLIPFLCHDFSARGLDPEAMLQSGLGHATSFRGSDSLIVIPGAKYYYSETEMPINSVNASEHSVSTTKIFTVGEQQMITDWLEIFPKGILSIVSDTFDLWKLITEYLPANKEAIMARDGKLVIRPDSGDPVDIICGIQEIKDLTTLLDLPSDTYFYKDKTFSFKKDEWLDILSDYDKEIHLEEALSNYLKNENLEGFRKWNGNNVIYFHENNQSINKGVIELLWDIFGGTINEQGYKVLDPHIGAIYGDSITLERQVEIYRRLEAKGFAATNIVLGVGSFTYQYNTRDTLGFAAKGAWFEVLEKSIFCGCGEGLQNKECEKDEYNLHIDSNGIECKFKRHYNIYKDPVTDDGTKKSLKGLQAVFQDENLEYYVVGECDKETENRGLLQVIYEDGKFYNQTTLTEVRENINSIV